LASTLAQQKVLPVNRMFTVDAGEPTPNLKCVVGFHSIEAMITWEMNCTEAHTKEMVLSKDLRKALQWVPGKRILKFGSQADGQPWPDTVASWACATVPMAGTVTFDCVPEVACACACQRAVWGGEWHGLRVCTYVSNPQHCRTLNYRISF